MQSSDCLLECCPCCNLGAFSCVFYCFLYLSVPRLLWLLGMENSGPVRGHWLQIWRGCWSSTASSRGWNKALSTEPNLAISITYANIIYTIYTIMMNYIYVYLYPYLYLYMSLYVYIHICIYMYILLYNKDAYIHIFTLMFSSIAYSNDF